MTVSIETSLGDVPAWAFGGGGARTRTDRRRGRVRRTRGRDVRAGACQGSPGRGACRSPEQHDQQRPCEHSRASVPCLCRHIRDAGTHGTMMAHVQHGRPGSGELSQRAERREVAAVVPSPNLAMTTQNADSRAGRCGWAVIQCAHVRRFMGETRPRSFNFGKLRSALDSKEGGCRKRMCQASPLRSRVR